MPFGGQPQSFDQPNPANRYWDPVWAAAQEAGLSINFHIGSSAAGSKSIDRRTPFGMLVPEGFGLRAGLAKLATMFFLENSQCLGDVIMGGVCQRFPDNIPYETDFPHPTSMSPGPQSAAEHPAQYVQRVWSDMPGQVLQAVLHDNAARVYHLS